MRRLMGIAKRITIVGLLSGSLFAQVNIENPQHVEVPEQRLLMLHRIICRVVTDQLHLRGSKAEFPITVVFGEHEQRVTVDEDKALFRIYLQHWDEPGFAISDLQLVLQQAMMRKHWRAMVTRVVERYHQVAPVDVGELNAANISKPRINRAATAWPFPEPLVLHSSGGQASHSRRGDRR